VVIFWDIENCAVPRGAAPQTVVRNLKAFASRLGVLRSIHAYGDFCQCNATLRYGLHAAGVSLHDVPRVPPHGAKDSSDKALLIDLMLLPLDDYHNPFPTTIVLVSGDVDFSAALGRLSLRGHRIAVLHPAGVRVRDELLGNADVFESWPAVHGHCTALCSASGESTPAACSDTSSSSRSASETSLGTTGQSSASSSPTCSPQVKGKHHGTISTLLKGCGFLTDGKKSYFFGAHSCSQYETLTVGTRVVYDLSPNPDKSRVDHPLVATSVCAAVDGQANASPPRLSVAHASAEMHVWEEKVCDMLAACDGFKSLLGCVGATCPLPLACRGPGKLKAAITARPHLFTVYDVVPRGRTAAQQWVRLAYSKHAPAVRRSSGVCVVSEPAVGTMEEDPNSTDVSVSETAETESMADLQAVAMEEDPNSTDVSVSETSETESMADLQQEACELAEETWLWQTCSRRRANWQRRPGCRSRTRQTLRYTM